MIPSAAVSLQHRQRNAITNGTGDAMTNAELTEIAIALRTLRMHKITLSDGVQAAIETLSELVIYLNSSKFSCGDDLDGYVSINDVMARIAPAQCVLLNAQEDTPYVPVRAGKLYRYLPKD